MLQGPVAQPLLHQSAVVQTVAEPSPAKQAYMSMLRGTQEVYIAHHCRLPLTSALWRRCSTVSWFLRVFISDLSVATAALSLCPAGSSACTLKLCSCFCGGVGPPCRASPHSVADVDVRAICNQFRDWFCVMQRIGHVISPDRNQVPAQRLPLIVSCCLMFCLVCACHCGVAHHLCRTSVRQEHVAACPF